MLWRERDWPHLERLRAEGRTFGGLFLEIYLPETHDIELTTAGDERAFEIIIGRYST